MSETIAVDIGGTHMRIARFDERGIEPLQLLRIGTQKAGEVVVDRLVDELSQIWPAGEKIAAIGIAAPGPVDQRAGMIYAAPNIPGWVDLPLRDILSDRFGVPVVLGNDANLAAYGEWKFGAGRGHDDVLYLTVSTGIGAGVISGGELLLGRRGLAAELGHVTIDPDGPLCGCGKPGHLEAFASGTAIARFAAGELARGQHSLLSGPLPTAQEIHAAAVQGDELAVRAIARAGHYLGLGVAAFLHTFNPAIVILGGGVSLSGELLFGPMRETLSTAVISPKYLQDLEIVPAGLGDDSGLLGALALARSFGGVL
jgi:glucokinase